MPGKITGPGRLIPGPGTPSAALAAAGAGQTVTVPKYPGALDDVGSGATLTFADDSTVLVALFTNFLGAVIQTIQAELGALAVNGKSISTRVAGKATLVEMLDQISLGTVANAGKLVGVKRWRRTSTAWGGQQTLAVDVGFRPNDKSNKPVAEVAFWAYLVQGQRTLAEVLTGPVNVRGRALFATAIGSTVNCVMSSAQIANANPGTGGAPTASASFTVEGLLFFMPVGEAAI